MVWLSSELMFFAGLFAVYFQLRAMSHELWAEQTAKLNVFGSIFIAGHVYEYAKLVSESVTLSSDRYGSVFYMATGFHGLHVTGGLIAFLLIIGRTFMTRRYTHTQAVGAVVTSYYWHFVDVVWIALFAVIYLLK